MVEDAGAGVVLTEAANRSLLGDYKGITTATPEEWTQVSHETSRNFDGGAVGKNLAYVIYTSGSTGRPKGVALTNSNAISFLSWARDLLPRDQREGLLASTSISFDLSVFEIFLPLCFGGRIVLVENAMSMVETGVEETVRVINTVPSAMKAVLDSGALPGSVRVVNLAGEAFQRELGERLYETGKVDRIYNLYGPTESTTYSTYQHIKQGAVKAPTIGKPTANTGVYVVDRELNPLPPGPYGELYIGGAGLARGYLGRPDLTGERFVPDPFGHEPGTRLYRTGDLVSWGVDGNLRFAGRLDLQVKVRGFRIELEEIEKALAENENLKDVAVLVREDAGGHKSLAAYVVKEGTGHWNASDLTRYLKGKLPGYMIPTQWTCLEQMPLTDNGKIDRKSLATMTAGITDSDQRVEPRTEMEKMLAHIWAEVLKIEGVGVNDDFFLIGGHSLLVMQVISRIEGSFGVKLPVSSVFLYPTIEELGIVLLEEIAREAQSIEGLLAEIEGEQAV